jgi:formate dehydrogenase
MRGSVGLNLHWGHKGGWQVAVAAGGARYNVLVPNGPEILDAISGNAWVNGIGVQVTQVSAAPIRAGTGTDSIMR